MGPRGPPGPPGKPGDDVSTPKWSDEWLPPLEGCGEGGVYGGRGVEVPSAWPRVEVSLGAGLVHQSLRPCLLSTFPLAA